VTEDTGRTSKPVERCALGLGHGAFVDLVCDLLGRGYGVRCRAKGGSMFPTFRAGEAITVAPVKPGGVRLGDIVLFASRWGVTAHRVVRVRQAGEGRVFITRGDASMTSDAPVEASAVLGRVVAVERGGRTVHLTGRQARLVGAVRSAAAHLFRRMRARIAP
jgi:signal peptidase I